MTLPTIEELRAAPANKAFFPPDADAEYRVEKMTVGRMTWKGEDLMVLKVTSDIGTKPIYRIDPGTLKLSYLTHIE